MTDDKLRAALDDVDRWREEARIQYENVRYWRERAEKAEAALAASATDEGLEVAEQRRAAVNAPHGPDDPAPGTALWRLLNYPETLSLGDARKLALYWYNARPAVPALDVERLADVLARRFPGNDDFADAAEYVAREYAALRSKEPTPSQDTAQLDWRDSR